MRKFIAFALGFLFTGQSFAQYPKDNPKDDFKRTTGFVKLKHLTMTPIAGAPILSQPQRIDGNKMEIRTGKHGLCYPALYDWNHDGIPDLLLGEFSTGEKENNIKVYINEGTKKKPKFSGKYFYATDTRDSLITNHQWCCIGIHPRFVDITGDGYPDLLSGQYNPGLISLWRGGVHGFSPREFVPQEGYDPKVKYYNGNDPESPNSNTYWNYTSAGFGDYNGDGLLDLFVGGSGGLRVALNVGTKENPKFGLRKPLYFIDGTRLRTVDNDTQRGIIKTYMTPIDWDGDGVLDLLVTDNYSSRASYAISFMRGVKTNLGLRFEKLVPLFTTPDNSKELPGCQPQIAIGDLNGDGVNDIILGISIPTINGFECADSVAWKWIAETGIEMPGKDVGEYYMYTSLDSLKARLHKNPSQRGFYLGNLKDEKYLTLRHRGYVFVMYGTKNPTSAPAPQTLTVEVPPIVKTQKFDNEKNNPVSYQITGKQNGEEGEIDIILEFAKGWHGYVEMDDPNKQEFIPTTVSVELPKEITTTGKVDKPYTVGNKYSGRVVFKQFFFKSRSMQDIHAKIKISYQVCNDQMCLPPSEHIIEKTINLK